MSELKGLRLARVATVPLFFSTHLKNQLPGLVAAGAHVTAISSDGPEVKDIEWSTRLQHAEIHIPRKISPFADLKALWRLWRHFRRNRYDIVHSTTPKAGLLTAIAARVAGVPVRLHTFTGQPWVTLRGPKAWLARGSDRIIGRLSSHCYADSASQCQFLIEEKIVSNKAISVLGHGSVAGVDTHRFDAARFDGRKRAADRAELGFQPEHTVFLFLGRVCRDKGIFELLEAFEAMRARGRKAGLLMAGPIEVAADDPEELSPEMFQRAGVTYLGFTNTPETAIALSDCLLLPSYREGFGSVVIEAAAMGVPAVGTDIYGLRDAIVDGETGLLIAPRDTEALIQAMETMCLEPERRATMGAAGRSRARADFATDVFLKAVIAEYVRRRR